MSEKRTMCDQCGAKIPPGTTNWYGAWHEAYCPLYAGAGWVPPKFAYNLPIEIAAAIGSDRIEMIQLYSDRIREKDPEKAELARLIGDLLMDRRKARAAIEKATDAIGTLEGSVRKAQRMGSVAALVIMGSEVPEELEQ